MCLAVLLQIQWNLKNSIAKIQLINLRGAQESDFFFFLLVPRAAGGAGLQNTC